MSGDQAPNRKHTVDTPWYGQSNKDSLPACGPSFGSQQRKICCSSFTGIQCGERGEEGGGAGEVTVNAKRSEAAPKCAV